MKRAKDKYMINRTKYKDIKRYDHKQMEDFLTDVYKNGYADGKESVPGVELQDVEAALKDVKGIGPVVWNRIQKAARSRATTMNKSKKYNEIILLGQMLQERKIEHEQHDLYDGYQIIVPLPEPTKEISVIEHQCSYGSIMNLLEIWADGSIQGYLSAKQTLKIIERIKARESPR